MSPAIAAARSRRAPRLLGHLLEHVAQHTPRAHTLREREPQRGAIELQFEPFRVATDAAPFPVGSAEELGGIKPQRVGVVAVHVRISGSPARSSAASPVSVKTSCGLRSTMRPKPATRCAALSVTR